MSHALENRCQTHTHRVSDFGCPERGCEGEFHGWAWVPCGDWCPDYDGGRG